MPLRISATEVQEWLECRLKWDYGSSNRQNLEPRKETPAYAFGTQIHHALEMYYSRGEDPAEAFVQYFDRATERQRTIEMVDGDEEKFKDLRELGISMLSHYRTWAAANDDFRAVHTELQ